MDREEYVERLFRKYQYLMRVSIVSDLKYKLDNKSLGERLGIKESWGSEGERGDEG